MNKRADIPVTILVIGVVGICILAILSFSFSIPKNSNVLIEPYLIEDAITISEQISFYEKNGINFESLMNRKLSEAGVPMNIIKMDDGNYLINETSRNSDGIVFMVEYNFNP